MIRILLTLMLSCSAASALNGRPEVVVLMWDDVSTQAIGAYGETDSVEGAYDTPNLDAVAAAGQLYLNFTSQPMCSPSRNDFWYGVDPLKHGAGRALNETNRRGVPWAQRESLVSALQAVGVQVGIVGKHHIQDFGDNVLLGTAATQSIAMGFDFSYAMMLGNPLSEYPPTAGSPFPSGRNHHYYWIESDPVTGAGSINTTYTTDAFSTAAITALQDNSDMRPMLLVVNYSAAHVPFNPPPGSDCGVSQSSAEQACYGASITYLDGDIPSIIAELDWAEDKLIIMSENGRPLVAQDTEHCDSALSKQHATPCGTRVPMVIRGAGVTAYPGPGLGLPQLVNIADMYDMLREMFGAPQTGQESESFFDCLANPTTCTTRSISSAIVFEPPGLPIPMYEGQDFSKYEMHFLVVGGTTLYGMNRIYVENDVLDFEDKLYDLGSPSTIDEAKRYGQVEIVTPTAGEQQDAFDAMIAEATRLVDARWAGPPNQIIGVEMVGVGTK